MKPNRFILIVLFTSVCIFSSAQVFVGGKFGFNTSGGSIDNGTTTTDKPSTVSFNFSPKAGIFISEKLAPGAALNFTLSRTKTPGITETIDKSTTIGVSPFLRYYAVKLNNFSLFAQGNTGFSYTKPTTKVGGTSTDGAITTNLYLNVVPGLAYDLNDKFSFETTINVLSLGYYHTTVKNGPTKNKTSSSNMGAGLDNIVTSGNISVGAIYKF
jgi:hypothetical protein